MDNYCKNKETIQSLTDTVKTIAACSNDIQKAAEGMIDYGKPV